MPQQFGIEFNEPKATKLNSKLEADYNTYLNMLGKGKKQQQQQQRRRQPQDPIPGQSAADQAVSVRAEIPTMITAQTDAVSQHEMLLRTRSPSQGNSNDDGNAVTPRDSSASNNDKVYLASSQNGIVITSSRAEDVPPRQSAGAGAGAVEKSGRNKHSSFDTDDSTLPTFLSVEGGSLNWKHDQRNDTLFLVAKNSIEDEPPLLKLVPLNESAKNNGSFRNTNLDLDRETQKKLHYKNKLHELTGRLTTNSAVERSKRMLSDIMERSGSTVVLADEQKKAAATTSNNVDRAEDGNNNNSREEEDEPKAKCIFDSLKKNLLACSMRICIDDAVVDHEGMVIAIPTKKRDCDEGEGEEGYEEFDRAGQQRGGIASVDRKESDVSSLTGMTQHQFQRRYWANYNTGEEIHCHRVEV